MFLRTQDRIPAIVLDGVGYARIAEVRIRIMALWRLRSPELAVPDIRMRGPSSDDGVSTYYRYCLIMTDQVVNEIQRDGGVLAFNVSIAGDNAIPHAAGFVLDDFLRMSRQK